MKCTNECTLIQNNACYIDMLSWNEKSNIKDSMSPHSVIKTCNLQNWKQQGWPFHYAVIWSQTLKKPEQKTLVFL
jgi:hypothetical protein